MHMTAVPAPAKDTDFVDPTEQYLTAALLARKDCAVLKELNELRGKGWRSDDMHEHFKHQRHQADYNKHDGTDRFWADMMYNSMWQMDNTAHPTGVLKSPTSWPPPSAGKFVQATRFLDIGQVHTPSKVLRPSNTAFRCCPGGYSTYVLRKCPEATGMGISLPVQDGGHGAAIPPDLSPRIDLVMQDVMAYDLAPDLPKPPTSPTPLSTLPFKPHTFDFVMCDAHTLRLCPDNVRRPWNWTRLVVSQLLLGLRAVCAGGTMFVKLSHVERPLTARILIALCRTANHVRTVKSRRLHASRGTFYVLAQGVRTSGEEYEKLVSGLEQLWYIMTFHGNEGYGREITWGEQDHVMLWTEVMSPRGVLCIVRLGTGVWQIQRDGLRALLEWKGVDVGGTKEVAGGWRRVAV